MNDCGNAEMRDQLPDLLHGRLDELAYAVVAAHIETCVDCHEELELLRAVLSMAHARTPKIDIAAIVRALPTPSQIVIVAETVSVSDVPASHSPVMVEDVMTPAAAEAKAIVDPRVVPITSRRRVWSDWRVAAAVTLLVAGGSSAVLLKRGPNVYRTSIPITRTAVLSQRAADSAPVATNSASSSVAGASVAANAGSATPATVADADDRANTDLGNGNRLGDLDEQQLQTLLNKIDNLPAVPVTEPEPVSLHVNSQSSSEGA
jgi:hypothetical protein